MEDRKRRRYSSMEKSMRYLNHKKILAVASCIGMIISIACAYQGKSKANFKSGVALIAMLSWQQKDSCIVSTGASHPRTVSPYKEYSGDYITSREKKVIQDQEYNGWRMQSDRLDCKVVYRHVTRGKSTGLDVYITTNIPVVIIDPIDPEGDPFKVNMRLAVGVGDTHLSIYE